jgi:hypothetical protein
MKNNLPRTGTKWAYINADVFDTQVIVSVEGTCEDEHDTYVHYYYDIDTEKASLDSCSLGIFYDSFKRIKYEE